MRSAKSPAAAGALHHACPPSTRARSAPTSDRMLGATSTVWTKPGRRVVPEDSSPGSTPGACTPTDGQVGAVAARVGRHHDHRVAFQVDLLEQPTEELVGPLDRLASAVGSAATGSISGIASS